MASYREGDRVKVTTTVHSSSGSGYPGDRGRVEALGEAWGQDVYRVGLDNGVCLERVRESDLTRD
ncbi:MAG: hypothetical protein QOI74_2924 [Micromonosporaceae bacterium]|nr:hypothetical protein [Micromonosporaceae bacterium]